MLSTPDKSPVLTEDAVLHHAEEAWQLHEEIRELARKHLKASTITSTGVSAAAMADVMRRFIEQVTGSPVATAEPMPKVEAHILNRHASN